MSIRRLPFPSPPAPWIAAALLLVYGAIAWSSVREKSTTFDEMAHLTAGYSYWLTGDYRLDPENGILPQRWVALPLLAQDVRFPAPDQPGWWQSDVWQLGFRFFYELRNDLGRMLWWTRSTVVLLGIALGGLVYAWSRRLLGPRGALFCLRPSRLSPTCLAHGRLATSDLAATLAFAASLTGLWTVAHRVSVGRVVTSGVAMGLLFVSKMSAPLILPVGLALIATRLAVGRPLIVALRGRHVVRRRSRQAAILALVAVAHALVVAAVIWLSYGLRYETFRAAEADRDRMYGSQTLESLTAASALGPVARWANDHHLLPKAYLHGLAFSLKMSEARSAFLNGRYSIQGWTTFFPYCLLVKTPLGTFVVMLAAAAAALARWRCRRGGRHRSALPWSRAGSRLYRTLPIWVFLGVYWAAALSTHLNIGHRHILPTYPLMFVLCGAAGAWIGRGYGASAVVVGLALTEVVVESVAVYPHYLAYFNPLAGGPRHGYRHLVDSSLDWGQDLPGLERWLKDHAEASSAPVYLSYFGTGSPEYYGIKAFRLPGYMDWRPPGLVALHPGTYCISATMLECTYVQPPGPWNAEYEREYWLARAAVVRAAERGRPPPAAGARRSNGADSDSERVHRNAMLAVFDGLRFARLCAYLRRREPEDSIGYSILIYRLSDRDIDVALNRPLAEW